jgi:tRNA A-37 threonylcarbamoyl transferase component Bud32
VHAITPGTIVGRDFRVVRPLAKGGMGSVYVAEQLSTGKQRALKLMRADLVSDDRSFRRFEEEARIGARIASDHVVEVVGAGWDEQIGAPWLAMELLDGETLESIVQREQGIPLPAMRELFHQIAHALGAAHAQGIVHRDLKPENIFIARSFRRDASLMVKILDFGIAKTMQESRTAVTSTSAIGTPLFMAPEQGTPGSPLRAATDVWALGLIAFYALTGRHYWRSGNLAEISLQGILSEVLVFPIEAASVRAGELGVAHKLPPGFDAWFARCVARDPAQRFAEASSASSALDVVLSATPTPIVEVARTAPLDHAMRTALTEPRVYAQPAPSKTPWIAIAIVGVALVVPITLAAGAVIYTVRNDEPVPVAPRATIAPSIPEVEVAPPPVTTRMLLVETNIEGASLWIDGTDRGPLTDAMTIAVDLGVHHIEARRAAQRDRSNTPVTPRPIAEATITVTEEGTPRVRLEGPVAPERDIDALLDDALGSRGARRAPPPRDESLPASPSRSDVMSAMNAVTPAVRACSNGASGTVTVAILFEGSTGRCTSATVHGDAPAPVASCIARAVRGARVPPFQNETHAVNYPFRY